MIYGMIWYSLVSGSSMPSVRQNHIVQVGSMNKKSKRNKKNG